MRWDQIYNLLERDESLLKDAALAKLLRAHLQEIEEQHDLQEEEEASRCKRLLDMAESYQPAVPPESP